MNNENIKSIFFLDFEKQLNLRTEEANFIKSKNKFNK